MNAPRWFYLVIAACAVVMTFTAMALVAAVQKRPERYTMSPVIGANYQAIRTDTWTGHSDLCYAMTNEVNVPVMRCAGIMEDEAAAHRK